jgi:hypothetical protein
METIISLIPMVIDLIGGLFGKSESDKTAEEISGLKASMPPEEVKAEQLAKKMSYMGLPEYEKYQEQIDQIVPKTFKQAEKAASSPSQLIQLGADALKMSNDAYNKLAVTDASARLENMRNYQGVLQHKAGMNLNIQGQNNAMDFAATQQEAQGTKDLISSITRGVGTSINTYAGMEKLDYLEEQNRILGTFFGTGGDTSPKAVAPKSDFGEMPSLSPAYKPPASLGTMFEQPKLADLETSPFDSPSFNASLNPSGKTFDTSPVRGEDIIQRMPTISSSGVNIRDTPNIPEENYILGEFLRKYGFVI